MALVTVETAKTALNITGGNDAVFAVLINRAQQTIEKITDTRLAYNAAAVDKLETAAGVMYPRTLPLKSISSITLDGQAVTDYEVDGNGIALNGGHYGRSSLYRYSRPRVYTVTYAGGYVFEGAGADLPEDLQEIAIELVAFFNEYRGTSNDAMLTRGRDARAAIKSIKQGIPRMTYDRLRPYMRQKPRFYDGY